MGRVTQIRVSGDNDAPTFPVKYEMHFFYCDNCGSFDIDLYEERVKFRKKIMGVCCNDCGQRYELGSSFFTSEENPKGYTMDDVPRPLNRNYHQVGQTLGPADEKE